MYIHYGDVHSHPSAHLDLDKDNLPRIEQGRVKNLPLVEDGDLVMVDASEDYEGVGKSFEITNLNGRKVVAGLHTLLMRAKRDVLADGFKGYLQFTPGVRNQFIRVATGISVFGISKTNVVDVELTLPEIPEQEAIAAILSDMDAEIAALEARRGKVIGLREGMLHELLTGGTRLL